MQSLHSFFSSIVFKGQVCPHQPHYSLQISKLIQWLIKYDDEYRKFYSLYTNNRFLYKLYGRDFTLDCEKALVAHDESIELLKTCSSLGLGFALILPVKELTSYFTVLQKLLELGLARLIITIISPNEDIESLNNLLSKIYSLRSDLEVIFICDIPTQLTSGLISSETFKQFGGQMVQHPKPISVKHASVDSCATRLQLYINAEGEIFPCAGLMGCEEFSLGNICTDSTATLMTNNNYYQNISQFVRQGPSIPDFDRINTKTDEDYSLDFPWICNQHVKSLNP